LSVPRLGPLKNGVDSSVTVDCYPGKTFQGVRHIWLSAQMTQNQVSYTVVVKVDNSDEELLAYMTATSLRFRRTSRLHVK